MMTIKTANNGYNYPKAADLKHICIKERIGWMRKKYDEESIAFPLN